jgi:tetratricopeptide (TPR) repeat protein
MQSHHYIVRLVISVLLATLFACSGGPVEKTESESFTSPARMLDQGVYFYNINDYAEAIDHFEKALLQYRSIDNQPGIANSCLNLANTYMAISNNELAAGYLARADSVIEQASLKELDDHLSLLKSSLAINTGLYDQALQELAPVLISINPQIQLAALKNRTTIAFIRNDDDRSQWLQKYSTLQRDHAENSSSHLARILRFEAEAADDADTKTALLAQSLAISQRLANRTAIAATLSQWGKLDIDERHFEDAEDKYLRALFIRHQLGDVKNSLVILKQLQVIYRQTDKIRGQLTDGWISKIESNELSDWDRLIIDLDNYPKHE